MRKHGIHARPLSRYDFHPSTPVLFSEAILREEDVSVDGSEVRASFQGLSTQVLEQDIAIITSLCIFPVSRKFHKDERNFLLVHALPNITVTPVMFQQRAKLLASNHGIPGQELMPIDRISSSPSLLETMRAIARDRSSGTHRGNRAIPTTPDPGPESGSASSNAPPTTELQQRLRELVAHVDVKDAQSLADAREPALREILLWEFGNDFRKDSQFLPMVDAINSALDASPQFQQRFAELITGLQK